jgi:hypothetical protein
VKSTPTPGTFPFYRLLVVDDVWIHQRKV